jgi:hypothetical protein
MLHDLDKSGFVISGTLQRDTRRYEFRNAITTVDLGLNLKDAEEMGLAFEHQFVPKGDPVAMMANLRENGATEAEIDFMFADYNTTRSLRRVELNAMTSQQFVEYLERKLRENKVTKVIPDQYVLAKAYVGMERGRRLQEAVNNLEIDVKDFAAPEDLRLRVDEMQKVRPELRWDAALALIAKGAAE